MAVATGDSFNNAPIRPHLIGRERERVFLHEELGRAIAGHGRLVLLSGEAGIGKTSLARAAVHEAQSREVTVLTGHCYDLSSMPPYGPWLDLALGYGQEPGLPPLPTAFAGGQLDEIGSQAALFAETLAFLTALCRRGPLLVLLEDLHWADSPSLELLRFLAARSGLLPVLFLVTYRVDELTRKHPLYQQLPGLIRAGAGLRLDLKRLDTAALRHLARAHHRLTPEDEARLCAYLELHSEGNPFFAVELMRALEEDGLLTLDAHGSHLATLDRVILPSLLTQVIDVRLARLGEATRKPLSLAAVIGQEIPLDLWAEVSELTESELMAIVEQAIEAHLLEADRGGQRVRFVHALTREALYESSFPPRRRLWHRAVAEALIARPNPDPDAIGFHLLQAGDERAPEWLTKAGNRAQRAYTWLAAAERFIAAATALEAHPEAKRERGWLLFRAARMLRLADPHRGLDLLRQALELALELSYPPLEGDTRYSIGLLLCYVNQFDLGLSEMSAGIDQLEALPPEELNGGPAHAIALADSLPRFEAEADSDLLSSVVLHRRIGMHHRRGGNPWFLAVAGFSERSEAIARTFIAGAETVEHPGTVVQSAVGHAYHGFGIARAAAGDVEAARAAFTRARTIYRAIDHDGVIALCCLSELRAVALVYAGDDPAYRQHLTEDAVRAFEHAGGAMATGLSSAICRLACMVIAGQWDEAVAIIDDSPRFETSFFRAELVEAAARIALARGEREIARTHIVEWFVDGPGQAPGSRLLDQSLTLQQIAIELALDAGDLEEAAAWLAAQDHWLAWSSYLPGGAGVKLSWAHYHRVRGNLPGAISCTELALTLANAPRQPFALLRAHRTMGELLAAKGERGTAAGHLQQAITLANHCHAPFERALAMLALGELRASEGRIDEVAADLDQARATLTALRAAPALARLAGLTAGERHAPAALPFGLTAREAEVLRLMTRGLTDAAVAERLFISPRTVSQHLRSVYAKLEVNTRAAATRAAIEHGLA